MGSKQSDTIHQYLKLSKDELIRELISAKKETGKYRAITDNSIDVIWAADLNLKITYMSPSIEKLTGVNSRMWIDSGLEDLVSHESLDNFKKLAEISIKNYRDFKPFTIERELIDNEGNKKLIEIKVRLLFDQDGLPSGFQGTARDITENKATKKALLESEEKFSTLAGLSPIAIMFYKNSKWTYANAAAEEICGYKFEELKNMYVWDIVAPEFKELIRQNSAKRQTGDKTGKAYEFKILTKDKKEKWVFLNGNTIKFGTEYVGMITVLDITERKNLLNQLISSRKMETVGQLAGGIAHDFNNILTVINGYSSYLCEKFSDNATLMKYIKQISDAGKKAALLTRQLLAFSRKQHINPRSIDLNRSIRDMQDILHRLIGEDILLKFDLCKNLKNLCIDPGQLDQILINLGVNARDAMPKGGTLSIKSEMKVFEDTAEESGIKIPAGEYILITLSDTGNGMDAETSEKIFEPFFTTKKVGKGTGLGLSTVYGIVKQNRGCITVSSEPGIGTSFKIYLLPTDKTLFTENNIHNKKNRDNSGTETILFTEDQANIRSLVVTLLRERGYNVLHAHNGMDALEKISSFSDNIDLLITDIVMPDMGGQELVEKVKRLGINCKYIFISGYTDDAVLRYGELDKDVPFINKPFEPEELMTLIRETLDS